MHEQDFSILKALVPVAWADGEFKEREKQTIDALLDAFGATDAEREAIDAFSKTPKKLEDIDLSSLSAGDRRQLLQHAGTAMHATIAASVLSAERLGQMVQPYPIGY